jgi:hypothetical protein
LPVCQGAVVKFVPKLEATEAGARRVEDND